MPADHCRPTLVPESAVHRESQRGGTRISHQSDQNRRPAGHFLTGREMGTPRASVDAQGFFCPACKAPIKAAPSARNRRVQCPKCREVVVLEASSAPPPTPTKPADPSADESTRQQQRIETLEARVAELEKTIADS